MADEKVLKKLHHKAGYKTLVYNMPSSVLHLFEGLKADMEMTNAPYDFVQVFVKNVEEADKLIPTIIKTVIPSSIVWIAYPKGSGKIKTDIHRDNGWDSIKGTGWEGVSLVSLDDTWSSMRFKNGTGATSERAQKRGESQKAMEVLGVDDILEFDVELIQDDKTIGMGYQFPYSVEECFGVKGQLRVKGTINGIPFQATLAPYGGVHYMGVTKKLNTELGKKPTDIVHVVLQADKEARVVEVPPDLDKALNANPAARVIFDNFAYTHRKEYVAWIESAKKQETRENRIEKAIAMITAGKKYS